MGDKKAEYWRLRAEADAAWRRGDMAEWGRLCPLAEKALAESGIEVRECPARLAPFFGDRPGDN